MDGGIAAQRRSPTRPSHGQLPLRARPLGRRRPRRGCARCASRTASSRSTRNAPSAPGARSPTRSCERLRAAGDLAVAPKQAWTPVAEFAAAGLDAINFGPGDPPQAHRRDEQVAVDALVRCLPRRWRRFACALNPVLDRPAARTRSCASTRRKQRLRAARRRRHRLRHRRAARGDARLHPRGARRARDRAGLDLPARPRACPSCAAAIAGVGAAPLRRGARPRHRGRPDARLQGGVFGLAQVVCGRRRSSPSRRPATRSTSAARCSPGARCSSCR